LPNSALAKNCARRAFPKKAESIALASLLNCTAVFGCGLALLANLSGLRDEEVSTEVGQRASWFIVALAGA
jgi:hypothetical protein